MRVKLNLQAIRIAEQLLKQPFSAFDLGDEETVTALMYGSVAANNEDERFTYGTFEEVLKSEKVAKEIANKVTAEMEFIMQFAKEDEKEEKKGKEDEKEIYMSEVASFLILSGMDATFVLYKMNLFEIEDYLKAIEYRKRETMEEGRLWTYFGILPHVDGDKLNSPDKLITFPWEKEAIKERERAELAEDIAMFKKFKNSKPLIV